METKDKYIIPIFVSHRGCPNDCVFCNQRKITGMDSDLTSLDVNNILHTYFSTLPPSYKDAEVAFYGGSFSGIDINKQKELLEAINQSVYASRISNIRISTRPDYISEEIVDFLKNNGVGIIELGVQSMDTDILVKSNRGHSIKDVYQAVETIKKHSIVLGLQMMIGLPGDNLWKVIHTALEISRLAPDFARIYPTLVIKQTELESMYQRGEYAPLTLEQAVEYSKVALSIFESNSIKVIRLGLQRTEGINLEGDVVAGPFHEAFRQLVEGQIAYSMVYRGLLDNTEKLINKDQISLRSNDKYISYLSGHRKENIQKLKIQFNISHIKIIKDDTIKFGDVLVEEIDTRLERKTAISDIFYYAIDYYKTSLNK